MYMTRHVYLEYLT